MVQRAILVCLVVCAVIGAVTSASPGDCIPTDVFNAYTDMIHDKICNIFEWLSVDGVPPKASDTGNANKNTQVHGRR